MIADLALEVAGNPAEPAAPGDEARFFQCRGTQYGRAGVGNSPKLREADEVGEKKDEMLLHYPR